MIFINIRSKKIKDRTCHSFDLQSPAGQKVPLRWRRCPVGWSPAALEEFLSDQTHRKQWNA